MHACTQIILAVAINGQRPAIPEDVPTKLRALIAACWVEDPKQRPGIGEVLAT